jgi:hypothetical protein
MTFGMAGQLRFGVRQIIAPFYMAHKLVRRQKEFSMQQSFCYIKTDIYGKVTMKHGRWRERDSMPGVLKRLLAEQTRHPLVPSRFE